MRSSKKLRSSTGGGGGRAGAPPSRRAPLGLAEGSPPHSAAPLPQPGAPFGGAPHAGHVRHPAHPANAFAIAVDPELVGNGGRSSTVEAVFRRG